MDFTTVQGIRKNSKVFVAEDDHQFVQNGESRKKRWLRCQLFQSNNCRATATIDKENSKLYNLEPHNHGFEIYKKDHHRIRRIIKARTESNPELSARQIYRDVTRNEDPTITRFPAMQSVVNRVKQRVLPPVPRTAEEFQDAIEHAHHFNQYFRRTVVQNGEVCGFLFATVEMMEGLQRHQKIAHDGTYYTVPRPNKQLYTIFYQKGRYHLPGMFMLMTGKDFDHYLACFTAVKEICPDWNPYESMSDFEIAPAQALQELFPNLKLTRCYFHFTKNAFKHVLKKGLSKSFRQKRFFRKWVKKVLAIPLAPEDRIQECFIALYNENPPDIPVSDRANFNKYKRYLERTWFPNEDACKMLSVYQNEHATNNAVESWHAILKWEVKQKRPNIWVFLRCLNNLAKDASNDYIALCHDPEAQLTRKRKKKVRQNLENRRKFERQLENGSISLMDFLDKLSHVNDAHIERVHQIYLRRLRAAGANTATEPQALPQVNLENSDSESDMESDSESDMESDDEIVFNFGAQEQRANNQGELNEVVDNRDNNNGQVFNNQPGVELCILCNEVRNPTFFFMPCGDAMFCRTCAEGRMNDQSENGRRCGYCNQPSFGVRALNQ